MTVRPTGRKSFMTSLGRLFESDRHNLTFITRSDGVAASVGNLAQFPRSVSCFLQSEIGCGP